MEWLREHYGEYRFFAQRDVVWTVQMHIAQKIQEANLPYRVFHNHTITKGNHSDLAILNSDLEIEVAIELQYEPSHTRSSIRSNGDIWFSKLQQEVVFWDDKSGSVKNDVQKILGYAENGHAKTAYFVFIDEGGYHRHRAPFPRSEWRDWGNGVRVLWSQATA